MARLGQIPEAVAAELFDATPPEADAQDSEDVGQVAAAGRVEYQALVEEPEQESIEDGEGENKEASVEELGSEAANGIGQGSAQASGNISEAEEQGSEAEVEGEEEEDEEDEDEGLFVK